MKRFLSTVLILVAVTAYCQSKENKTPDELKTEVVKIKTIDVFEGGKLPFSSVYVLDYRFDTSKIGFSRFEGIDGEVRRKSLLFGRPFKKMIVKNGLQFSVADFFNTCYKNRFSEDSTKLLIVIKRFWADPFPYAQNMKGQSSNLERASALNLYVQFDFFLKKNEQCLPLTKIDTVFQILPNTTNAEFKGFITGGNSIYEYALAKMFELPNYQFYADRFDIAKSKRHINEVIAYYEKYFNYPVLKDSVLAEGVYMSFSEFRNNQPSIKKYSVTTDMKIGKTLYKYSGEDSSRISKPFGYCDGKNIYCGDFRYPLVRAGNTFDFFTKRTDNYFTDIGFVLPVNGGYVPLGMPYSENTLEPFQIDMETGKIY